MANESPNDQVVLKHGKIKGSPVVTRRAFEKVWKGRGYDIDTKATKEGADTGAGSAATSSGGNAGKGS